MSTLKGISKNKTFKRNLRQNLTSPEQRLWSRLRLNQFYELKFRRQHGIGRYIVDFFCPQLKVVLEIDGDSHYNGRQLQTDPTRDLFLKSLGINVFRYTNNDVMNNVEGVLMDLALQLKLDGPTSPGPSLQRRGEKRAKNVP